MMMVVPIGFHVYSDDDDYNFYKISIGLLWDFHSDDDGDNDDDDFDKISRGFL